MQVDDFNMEVGGAKLNPKPKSKPKHKSITKSKSNSKYKGGKSRNTGNTRNRNGGTFLGDVSVPAGLLLLNQFMKAEKINHQKNH